MEDQQGNPWPKFLFAHAVEMNNQLHGAYIAFQTKVEPARTEEFPATAVVDFDANGHVIGMEIRFATADEPEGS